MTPTRKPARTTARKSAQKSDVEPVVVAVRRSPAPVVKQPLTPRRRVMRGRKEQLTVTLDPDLIDRIEAAAAELDMSRNAWVTLAVKRTLAQNLRLTAGSE